MMHIGLTQSSARTADQESKTTQNKTSYYTQESLDKSLRVLLATHPTPGVRTELYDAIKNGDVAITWTDDYPAAFMLVPKQVIISSEYDTHDLQPVLMIRPQTLIGNKDYAQMVLFHEYVHFRQWKYKTLPEDTFLFEPLESSKNPADRCTKKWRAELEAYHKECEFALMANTAHLLPFCAYAGTPAYKEQLFKALKEGDKSMELCASVVQIL
jgi:hypothetical protein